MGSMMLGDSSLESLTPSVNPPLMTPLKFLNENWMAKSCPMITIVFPPTSGVWENNWVLTSCLYGTFLSFSYSSRVHHLNNLYPIFDSLKILKNWRVELYPNSICYHSIYKSCSNWY
jgi:hypothetical protein